VKDGEVLHEMLRVERLTADEVEAEARRHGIADLRDVRLAVLESDGRFSFITANGEEPDDSDDDRRAM
jgi:uncharacterized membrane protein YcaP (DUF421 family)